MCKYQKNGSLSQEEDDQITVDFTCGFILEIGNVRSGPVHCILGCIVGCSWFGYVQNC